MGPIVKVRLALFILCLDQLGFTLCWVAHARALCWVAHMYSCIRNSP
jgi:hypothetical protein